MYRKILSLLLAALLGASVLPALGEEMSSLAPTATPSVYRELLNGSSDAKEQDSVVMLQRRLIEIGYLTGKADGAYGAKTEAAVRLFQERNGLPVTGIADIDTQLRIYTDMNCVPAPTPEPTPRVRGTSGEDIREVQEKLAAWGFLNGNADGAYGKATEAAVKAYKTYVHDLAQPEPTPTPAPTPEPNPYVAYAEEIDPASLEEPEPFVANGEIDDAMLEDLRWNRFQVYQRDLKRGDEGVEVRRLQTRLSQLGYLYSGNIDGAFGQMTAAALGYFQRRNGLDPSGEADEGAQRVLYSPQAEPSDERVFPYKLYVDVSDQRVYVYRWTGDGYNDRIKTFVCSTGRKETPTILGSYSCAGRSGEWYYFPKYDCWARYAFRISGGYLFHSVTFASKTSGPNASAVRNLGSRASHGCVRLSVEDAKWIYENCPNGITVVIQE